MDIGKTLLLLLLLTAAVTVFAIGSENRPHGDINLQSLWNLLNASNITGNALLNWTGQVRIENATNPALLVNKNGIGFFQLGGSTLSDNNGDLTLDSDTAQTVVNEDLQVNGLRLLDNTGTVRLNIGANNKFTGTLNVTQNFSVNFGMFLVNTATSRVEINSSNNLGSFMVYNTTGSTHLFINGSNGFVGIGTNKPASSLHVIGEINASTNIRTGTGSAGSPSHTFDGNNNTGMFNRATNAIGFSTNGAERLTIDNTGRVGILKTGPNFALDVNGAVNATNFTTDIELITNTCNTAACTATATCSTGKRTIWGLASTSSLLCAGGATDGPNNCDRFCAPGTSSCSVTATVATASVRITCAKIT